MAPTTAHKKLRKRLKALPQGILNRIKDFTLAYDPASMTRVIDEKYRPPIQLHMNRQLRQDFMLVYYGATTVWTFKSVGVEKRNDPSGATTILDKWLRSLSLPDKLYLQVAGLSVSSQQKQPVDGSPEPREFRKHISRMTEGLDEWRVLSGVVIAHEAVLCWIHVKTSTSLTNGLQMHRFETGSIKQFDGSLADVSVRCTAKFRRESQGITGRRSKKVREKIMAVLEAREDLREWAAEEIGMKVITYWSQIKSLGKARREAEPLIPCAWRL